jgi:hypothetical protein
MTEPGAGSKWQGLQLVEQAERGAHPRVEPDPLQDLVKLYLRHLIKQFQNEIHG